MAQYLLQVSYTAEAWSGLVKHPQNRMEVISKSIEKLGGTLLYGWMSFGDYDTIAVLEMPDNLSAAAFSMAIAAGGSCKSIKTSPLLSSAEGVAALKKAAHSGYEPVAS